MEQQNPKPNTAGHTKYPIKEGTVFRLKAVRKIFNREVKAKVNHVIYIWIQRLNTGKYDGQPKSRPIKVLFLQVPVIAAFKDKYIIRETSVQLRYIANELKRYDYDVVARNCKFNYSNYCYFNFYKYIGLIPKKIKFRQPKNKSPI